MPLYAFEHKSGELLQAVDDWRGDRVAADVRARKAARKLRACIARLIEAKVSPVYAVEL